MPSAIHYTRNVEGKKLVENLCSPLLGKRLQIRTFDISYHLNAVRVKMIEETGILEWKYLLILSKFI